MSSRSHARTPALRIRRQIQAAWRGSIPAGVPCVTSARLPQAGAEQAARVRNRAHRRWCQRRRFAAGAWKNMPRLRPMLCNVSRIPASAASAPALAPACASFSVTRCGKGLIRSARCVGVSYRCLAWRAGSKPVRATSRFFGTTHGFRKAWALARVRFMKARGFDDRGAARYGGVAVRAGNHPPAGLARQRCRALRTGQWAERGDVFHGRSIVAGRNRHLPAATERAAAHAQDGWRLATLVFVAGDHAPDP